MKGKKRSSKTERQEDEKNLNEQKVWVKKEGE